ncbi:MAG: sodium:solute symporter, partial [Saprospiraceae bacterium]|nr:sodium:solute symporter [Saprospiraceae bacterium]
LPIYYKLNVYTAYEYLESRFDAKTRVLTAFLFLVQRGLAAGITIYAPAIILSAILGWSLSLTILIIGAVVIFYTVVGGTKAVSQTQQQQMVIILGGMTLAFFIILSKLPEGVGFSESLTIAGGMNKLNVIDFNFSWDNRYNFWSGIFGGTFLFLSYFGTDQSQVQRYLSGKSLTESRLGLLFNGILKVPMQFLVLFVGIMVFVFFQFTQGPIHFNNDNLAKLRQSEYATQLSTLESRYDQIFEDKKTAVIGVSDLKESDPSAYQETRARINELIDEEKQVRDQVKTLITQSNPAAETNDKDYVFINFVVNHLPVGIIGLLLAVIFSAAMSSTSSELNALATTTVIDFYRRFFRDSESDHHYLLASKGFTIMWGVLALCFAAFASLFDNLIQAVNIIGSLFYGTILGVFLVAFFMKKVRGTQVFIAAVIAEILVLIIYFGVHFGWINIAYLWLNAIGCLLVMAMCLIPISFREKA